MGKDSVVLNYRNTTIVLENSTFSHNKRHSTTTVKCPFYSTNGFKFNISTEDAFTHAGKVFGIHDIQKSDEKFDNKMYLKSSDKEKLLTFLDNEIITKQYLDLARNISYGPIIKITDDNHTFSLTKNQKNTLWLYVESLGLEEEKEDIKMYFETFKLTLDRLIEIGEAEDIDPNIQ